MVVYKDALVNLIHGSSLNTVVNIVYYVNISLVMQVLIQAVFQGALCWDAPGDFTFDHANHIKLWLW